MICVHENGDPATESELAAIEMMMHNIRCTLPKDPAKIELLPGFKQAVLRARHNCDYWLLNRECRFHW